jgi:hypothetical protein
MLDLDRIYVLDENIILKSINDKFWALDTKSGKQYKLNRTAYDLLSQLDNYHKMKDILIDVSSRYDVEPDVFQKDANRLIEYALQVGIVKKEEF